MLTDSNSYMDLAYLPIVRSVLYYGNFVQNAMRRMPADQPEPMLELIGAPTVKLIDILDNKLTGNVQAMRKVDYEFCDAFANSVLYNDKSYLAKYKRFERFVMPCGLPENFSYSYGERIALQLANFTSQLVEGGRRACMSIWQKEDYELIANPTFNGEFACAMGIQGFVRNNALHMHVHMRSSNVYTLLPLDTYVFTTLQKHIADSNGFAYGYFTMSFGSAHIMYADKAKAAKLLNANS